MPFVYDVFFFSLFIPWAICLSYQGRDQYGQCECRVWMYDGVRITVFS